jgi:hypothetical protein
VQADFYPKGVLLVPNLPVGNLALGSSGFLLAKRELPGYCVPKPELGNERKDVQADFYPKGVESV